MILVVVVVLSSVSLFGGRVGKRFYELVALC
jgi:hypothetical protein